MDDLGIPLFLETPICGAGFKDVSFSLLADSFGALKPEDGNENPYSISIVWLERWLESVCGTSWNILRGCFFG